MIRSGHLFRYGDVNDPRFRRKVLSFEELFAGYLGVRRVLATNSGTSSLFIALHAMGFRPGDEVIVPTFGFAATYHAPVFAGLVPVLAEIDDSLCLDPADIEHRITARTKAIIPVHMLGNPATWTPSWASRGSTGWPSSKTPARPPGPVTAAGRWGRSDRWPLSRSTCSRPSPPATAAHWRPATKRSMSGPSACTTRVTSRVPRCRGSAPTAFLAWISA